VFSRDRVVTVYLKEWYNLLFKNIK
jgi:hypothetical protein